jgi:large subunit ribosomal protein L17
MRHRVDHRKLGRTAAHRKAMLANMVTSLFDKERITTTDAKAKEARRTAERLITRAKKGYRAYQEHKSLKESGKEAEAQQMQAEALAHWRQVSRVVKKRATIKKLFDEIAPQYLERPGGYTRILHLENRLGDNAKTVLLELIKEDDVIEETPKKKTKAKAKKKAPKKEAAAEKPPAEEEKAEKEEASAEEAPAEEAKAAGDAAEKAEDAAEKAGDEPAKEDKKAD